MKDNKLFKLEIENEILKSKLELYSRDILTGLKLRRDFESKFEDLMNSGSDFILTIVDINGLHNINQISYASGDKIIKQVANKLISCERGLVYRIGGDEFAILSAEPISFDTEGKFVYASVSKPEHVCTVQMFDDCDEKLKQEKEKFYSNSDLDRRS